MGGVVYMIESGERGEEEETGRVIVTEPNSNFLVCMTGWAVFFPSFLSFLFSHNDDARRLRSQLRAEKEDERGWSK